jgi:16S rRNA (guanine527-N7)-methyltransferase
VRVSQVEESAVRDFFGDSYPVVARFAELLADQGVRRGLIGPREAPILWERHLLNSAAVVPFLPVSGRVIDIGSGAGLPGIVIAAMRPHLDVVLVESMARRADWLSEVVAQLALSNTSVRRARAEELHGKLRAEVVTARAVAPLDRLVQWAMPLLGVGGTLLALKGRSAQAEVQAAASTIRSLGGTAAEVVPAATVAGVDDTTIVRIVRESVRGPRRDGR